MPRLLKTSSLIVLTALAYWTCARLGLYISFEKSNATLIWIPTGLAVGIVSIYGYRLLPGILIGAFLANYQGFQLNDAADVVKSIQMSVFISIGNTLEALLGAHALNRTFRSQKSYVDHKDVFYFAALAIPAVTVSALTGVSTLWLNGVVPIDQTQLVFRIWFLGDLSGLFLVAPLIVLLAQNEELRKSFRTPEFMINALIIVSVAAYVFFTDNWTGSSVSAYILLPFLMWSAFRFSMLEMAFLLFVTVVIVLLGTINGKGPFATSDLQVGLLQLQMFNSVLAISFYALSAVINQNQQIQLRLASNNENLESRILERTRALNLKLEEIEKTSAELEYLKDEFQMACDIALLGHFQWNVKNGHLYWSEQMYRIFGVNESNFIASYESYMERIHPHDRERVAQIIQMAFQTRQPYEMENRIFTPNGEVRWLSARGRVLSDENGEITMFVGTAMDITALKNKESLSEHLVSIIEHSQDGIISINTDGTIINWNKSAEKLYEASKSTVVGTSIYDLIETDDERERLRERLELVRTGKVVTADDVDIKIHNRAKRSFWVTYTPIYDFEHEVTGISIFLRDITQRKAQEDDRFKMIVDTVPNLIFLINEEACIELANQHALQLLNFTENEILHQRFDLLVDSTVFNLSDDEGNLYDKIAKFLRMPNQDKYVKHKNGLKIPVECQITPIETSDGPKLLVAMVDLTERLRLEAEKREQKVVQESLRVKDQFMANMSHEIRTPMNAIIGFTDLLDRSDLNHEQKEYVEAIRSSGRGLLTIVNDILDLSKIQNGKIAFERNPMSIVDIGRNLFQIFEPKAKAKGLRLNCLCDHNESLVVWGDQVRLSQIFINLLSNALKFTEHGEVSMGYEVLKETTKRIKIKFFVADSGIGIEPNLQERIFDRFTQANTETNRLYGGTGLGLSIVRGLVDSQGGSIELQSKPGEGTRFSFTLDFDKYLDNQSFDRSSVHTSNEEREYQIKNKKVLLVEDNKLNQRLAITILKQVGCEVVLAENGEEALEKLGNDAFDIVLMDMQMPVMDGYTAVTKIRNDLHMDIPIIAMTAHAMAGERDKCIGLGMNEYISKPFNRGELFAKMEKLVA